MEKGLVLGKFLPLHKGHLALIEFAKQHCEHLIILLCVNNSEPIDGHIRLKWLKETFKNDAQIEIQYAETDLPATSESSRSVSEIWSAYLKERFPDISIIFTSEKYGDYVAEYMNIKHKMFDNERIGIPISATLIREKSLKYWDFIPPSVQPYFVKKIALYGAESTGKSTLSEQLALHFKTAFVPEMARFIVAETENCTYNDMFKIAEAHAHKINKQVQIADRILILDTDLLVTKVYSDYLFNEKPIFEDWIEKANNVDFYLFLQPDIPHFQDGTRLGEQGRSDMHPYFEKALKESNKKYTIISGSGEERFLNCIYAIKKYVLND